MVRDERDEFGSTPRLRQLEFEGTRDVCPWLTVPTAIDFQEQLGLEPTEILLLALTYMLSINTMSTGRTTHLHGLLHIVLFCAYVVLIFDV